MVLEDPMFSDCLEGEVAEGKGVRSPFEIKSLINIKLLFYINYGKNNILQKPRDFQRYI
jgi:hypothetical protein